MKALHKLPIDPLNIVTQHAEVRKGMVTVATSIAAIKMDAVEVFGPGVIDSDETFYINRAQWGKAKMDKAVTIEREGLLFKGFDAKGNPTGIIEASPSLACKYWVLDEVNPRYSGSAPVLELGISATAVQHISEVLGDKLFTVRAFEKRTNFILTTMVDPKASQEFRDMLEKRTILLSGCTIDEEKNTFRLFEGSIGNNEKEPSMDYDEELQIKSDEIAELRTRLAGVTTAETGIGDLVYKADNLALAELMDDFIELVRGGNAKEIMETMKIL